MSGRRKAKKIPPKIQRGNYAEIATTRGVRVVNFGTPVDRVRHPSAPMASGSQFTGSFDEGEITEDTNYQSHYDTALPTPDEVRRSYGRVNNNIHLTPMC
jgi:hypothetical protein